MNPELTRSSIKILLLSALAFNAHPDASTKTESKKLVFHEQRLEIDVEMATSQEQRERGLMFRPHLDENSGMLFVYSEQAPQSVWMKNTLIPLDVLFVSKEGRIVSMLENLQPCEADPCPIFGSVMPAMYMLEVNAGVIKTNDLKIGQELRLPDFKKNGLKPAH